MITEEQLLNAAKRCGVSGDWVSLSLFAAAIIELYERNKEKEQK